MANAAAKLMWIQLLGGPKKSEGIPEHTSLEQEHKSHEE
jgi:hypothetical protein